VKIRLVTSTTIAAISPGPRMTDTALNAIGHLPIVRRLPQSRTCSRFAQPSTMPAP
jgi:hypothetical protein